MYSTYSVMQMRRSVLIGPEKSLKGWTFLKEHFQDCQSNVSILFINTKFCSCIAVWLIFYTTRQYYFDFKDITMDNFEYVKKSLTSRAFTYLNNHICPQYSETFQAIK